MQAVKSALTLAAFLAFVTGLDMAAVGNLPDWFLAAMLPLTVILGAYVLLTCNPASRARGAK